METRNDIDLRWAHPALAKCARKIFRKIRRDAKGRLNVADARRFFGRHGDPMLDPAEYRDGSGWAFLCGRWQDVLKDWGQCAGVSVYCITKDEPRW